MAKFIDLIKVLLYHELPSHAPDTEAWRSQGGSLPGVPNCKQGRIHDFPKPL